MKEDDKKGRGWMKKDTEKETRMKRMEEDEKEKIIEGELYRGWV